MSVFRVYVGNVPIASFATHVVERKQHIHAHLRHMLRRLHIR